MRRQQSAPRTRRQGLVLKTRLVYMYRSRASVCPVFTPERARHESAPRGNSRGGNSRERMRLRLASLLAAVVAAGAAAVADAEAADLAAENSMLQLKLKRLEDELQQELKYAPVLMRSSRSLRAVRTCQAVRTRGAGQLSHQTAGKGVTGRGEGHDCRGCATSPVSLGTTTGTRTSW